MKISKLLIIIAWIICWYNSTYATSLSVSVVWWATQSYYYDESVTLTANATFPETCSSTWITWAKSIPWFPFPTIITVGSWPTYSFTLTWNTTYNVTASCSASLIVDSVNVSIKDPIVSAWTNLHYNTWDTVNMIWSIAWPTWTNYDFEWEQLSWITTTIYYPSWTNVSQNSLTWYFIYPDSLDDIIIKLKVTPLSWYYSWIIYSWTTTYTRNTTSWWNTNWRSIGYRMQDEAVNLFYDTSTVEKIDINLHMKKENSPLMNFFWDSIWWDWYIQYILEYSTWSKFSSFQIFETTQNLYNYIEYNLDKDNLIHFFRLKACYKDKCSKYSNIIKYYSNDYLKLPSYKNYFKPIDFNNIFNSYDMIINIFYKPYSEIPKIKY